MNDDKLENKSIDSELSNIDIEIISTVLHQIDVENKESTLIPITSISSDTQSILKRFT